MSVPTPTSWLTRVIEADLGDLVALALAGGSVVSGAWLTFRAWLRRRREERMRRDVEREALKASLVALEALLGVIDDHLGDILPLEAHVSIGVARRDIAVANGRYGLSLKRPAEAGRGRQG